MQSADAGALGTFSIITLRDYIKPAPRYYLSEMFRFYRR